MSEKEKRTIYPVIVTDRVADDRLLHREWELSRPLICWPIPSDYARCGRPIYIIVDNADHLEPLLHVGVALAWQASAMPGVFDFGSAEDCGEPAIEAEAKTAHAITVLNNARIAKQLPDEVFFHLRNVLIRGKGHCPSFSTSWVYGSILYGPLALASLRAYEDDILTAFFGKGGSDPKLKPKDRERGRIHFKELDAFESRLVDRPRGQWLVKELTNKLLENVLPNMLPGRALPRAINCTEIDDVSRAPRRDIALKPKLAHEQNPRSSESIPFTSFLA